MRKFVPLLSLSAAIVLILVGILGTGRFAATPAAAQETLTLIEHASNETVVDLAEEGDSVGDTLVFHNELYDSTDVNLVGTSSGSCVRTEVGLSWSCTFTNSMEHGSLVVVGTFYDSGQGLFAITGGTGEFSSATGQMSLTTAEGSTAASPKWKFDFEIN
jgi:allene oxide cyclase